MSTVDTHIIQKVVVDVQVGSQETAYRIKEQLSGFLENQLFPKLLDYLEQIPLHEGAQLRLEQVSLEISDSELLKVADWEPQISKQMEGLISKLYKDEPANDVHFEEFSAIASRNDALRHFLLHGNLPWWSLGASVLPNTFERWWYEAIEDKDFVTSLLPLLNNPLILSRFTQQLPFGFLQSLIPKLAPESPSLLSLRDPEWQQCLSQLPEYFKAISCQLAIAAIPSLENSTNVRAFAIVRLIAGHHTLATKQQHEYVQLLNHFLENTWVSTSEIHTELTRCQCRTWLLEFFDTKINLQKTNNTFPKGSEAIEKTFQKTTCPDAIIHPFQAETTSTEKIISEEKSSQYLENAGLILLHPFLKHFFQKTKVLNEQHEWNDVEKAIQLLHFMATGALNPYEYQLGVEKLLCGSPQETPLTRKIGLSDQEQRQAIELLQAVLDHLPQLKTNSIALLRHEFLQRPGKYVPHPEHPKLIIEQKTQDILLNQVPWNLSVIAFPWRKKLLYCDW